MTIHQIQFQFHHNVTFLYFRHGFSGWCIFAPHEQLFVGDFNGDGRDDILCHNYGSGRRMGSYANADASFTSTDW